MDDWARCREEAPWCVPAGATVEVGDAVPWDRGPVEGLPFLSRLLASARVTAVSVDGVDHDVLAWGAGDTWRAWLGPAAPVVLEAGAHPLQRALSTVCGGILERFCEPTTWWLNQHEVLTATAAQLDVASMLDAYSWKWSQDGLVVPEVAGTYDVVAIEANGNLTLVNRSTGGLVLFAPDHDFDLVTPVPGCPPYSLMTIDGVPDLASWIEVCARAWLA